MDKMQVVCYTDLGIDLGAAPFRAAAARRVIFIGGGGAPTDFC
jgi:hypothetical protein